MAYIQLLQERRFYVCLKFICTLTSGNPVYELIKNCILDVKTNYSLGPTNLTVSTTVRPTCAKLKDLLTIDGLMDGSSGNEGKCFLT